MNHPGKYCSRDCRDQAVTTIPDAPCAKCGNPVQPPKGSGRRKVKKFCSRPCYYESLRGVQKREPRDSCVVCGEEVGRGARKYCSRDCYLSEHTADNNTPELELLRGSAAYREWRSAVFARDDYTCQLCNNRGGFLHADHIKSFAHHPESRFDLTNGRTLCVACHRGTPNYGFRAWRVASDSAGY